MSDRVSCLTSFVRALVRKPSCFSSNRSNRNLVTTNPRHESPMNSRVSKLCLVGSSFSLLLWVNARWYKFKSLIFVPRISSIEALVSSISVYRLQTYFLSLHVVRGQILLEVEERDDDIRRGFEEVSEGVVQDDLSSVLRVFQSLAGDVLVDLLGDLGAGDELLRCETQEGAEFVVDFLLTIEPVVRRPCLRLAPVGVVLLGFDLSTKLGEGLDLGAEGGDFLLEVELGGFRHLIPFLWVVSLSHEQGAQGDQ